MDKEIVEEIFAGVKTPSFIKVLFVDSFAVITSAQNKNEGTGDWFLLNSEYIEKLLTENGISWVYLFETAPSAEPFVYMLMEEGLTKELAIEKTKEMVKSLPQGREAYYFDCPFAELNLEEYDHSSSNAEETLIEKAAQLFACSNTKYEC